MTEEERKKFNRLVEVVEDLTVKIDNLQKQNKQKRRCGKSCVNSIKMSLLGENYGRNNFYQGGFST